MADMYRGTGQCRRDKFLSELTNAKGTRISLSVSAFQNQTTASYSFFNSSAMRSKESSPILVRPATLRVPE